MGGGDKGSIDPDLVSQTPGRKGHGSPKPSVRPVTVGLLLGLGTFLRQHPHDSRIGSAAPTEPDPHAKSDRRRSWWFADRSGRRPRSTLQIDSSIQTCSKR